MAPKIHEAGLTLLEIIVVTSIIMLLTGGVVAGYSTFNSNQRVKQAVLTFKNDLRAAATKAAVGRKPASGCVALDGYTVTLTGSSYTVQARCDGAVVNDSATQTSVTLPSDMTISTAPVTANFTFYVLARGTSLANPVTITIATPTKSDNLIISTNGDIN